MTKLRALKLGFGAVLALLGLGYGEQAHAQLSLRPATTGSGNKYRPPPFTINRGTPTTLTGGTLVGGTGTGTGTGQQRPGRAA